MTLPDLTASLPMYDWPELHAAHDSYWQAIRAALGHGPAHLTRAIPDLMTHWQRPDLLLTQTCGLPYRHMLHNRVTLLGTPDYGLPGNPPGHYHSVLIAHAQDSRTELADFTAAIFAYNETGSQSGWAAPMTYAAELLLEFPHQLATGGHRASIHAVAQGRAGLAAIDAVTWAFAQRYEPATKNLRVIATTPPTPGLPYICAPRMDAAALRDALQQAMAALDPDTRDALMLQGLCPPDPAAYHRVPTPPVPKSQAHQP